MSMTYYAVTDDPNELAHFGILGMKWGRRRTPEQLGHPRHSGSRSRKPRSAAYKKAESKLSSVMRNGIEAAKTRWNTYNSPAARYERQTNRAIEKARKGKLKYGKLTDDQVRRVTERLNLERQARQLADTEQTFRHRLAKSIGEGVVTGIGQGFGRRASEFIARGSVLKTDRLRAEQQDELDREKEKRRIRNAEKEAKKKIERDFKQKKREDEYNDEREFRKKQRDDAYAEERDRRLEEARVRNLYEYGAVYDRDGKLDYTDRDRLENYYQRRYLSGETRTESRARQEREAAQHQREAERERRRQYRQDARGRARERRVMDRNNRLDLSRASEQINREQRLERLNAAYDRKQEREAIKQAKREQRLGLSSGYDDESRRRIDEHNTSRRRKRTKGRR